MEHLNGGSLREYVESKADQRLSEQEAQKVIYDVGNALNFCHQRRVVHRDIKLENIMLRDKENLQKGLVLIDFGIAGSLQRQFENLHEGTLRYSPPELLSGQNFKADSSFDVWSLGILLYLITFGKFPFNGETWHEIKQAIVSKPLCFPEEESSDDVSDTCIVLIKLMLCKDANQRPKLYQLIQHPWIVSGKSQLQVMNMSMYQQNTMMNFFKQELKQMAVKKEAMHIPLMVQPPIAVIKIRKAAAPLKGINKERSLSKFNEEYFRKKYAHKQSPTSTGESMEKGGFMAALGDYQLQMKEAFQNSLSVKKQRLGDIRSLQGAQDSPRMKSELNELQVRQNPVRNEKLHQRRNSQFDLNQQQSSLRGSEVLQVKSQKSSGLPPKSRQMDQGNLGPQISIKATSRIQVRQSKEIVRLPSFQLPTLTPGKLPQAEAIDNDYRSAEVMKHMGSMSPGRFQKGKGKLLVKQFVQII